jgi:signal transduction histidine kinase/BarA-like signal transduction histidine kinase
MEKLRNTLHVSFSTKVVVPVVATMVLLMAVTVWVVNERLTEQFQADGVRSLERTAAEFQVARKSSTRNLVQRLKNLRNEPQYKALLTSGHVPTLAEGLKNLPAEQGIDVALFTSDSGKLLVKVKGDPQIALSDFEMNSSAAVRRALQGEDTVDIIQAGDDLFDVVSIPVTSNKGALVGVLTFGSQIRNADVRELRATSQSEIVLLAKGRVITSTAIADPQQDFPRLFEECLSAPGGGGTTGPIKQTLLGGGHYFCSAGKFPTLNGNGNLGYLLLYSYEQPLRALRGTQQLLLGVSSLGILLGAAGVWFLVRKVTQPLRALSISAEAVGRGDFSRRVEVTSSDECGELAAVFNQMTENVKRSREQLEQTVDTLKTTQAQLVQSEKLSGIGEFVAGVAHELNNPLTSVMGFSELLAKADTDPQHKRFLEMISKSAQRCHKIVQSLLSFARRRAPERKLSGINELVESAVEFLQYQLRTSNIDVVTRLDANLPKAMVDPHQIQQVFLNIINNARQAIEGHQPKGSIRISSETCGHLVRVTFQDDGPGIPEKNLSKVFDPFFTTKEIGKGTGLGLSLCYGMVKEHGGSINVRSKPDEGATFVIELPVAAATEEITENTDQPVVVPVSTIEGLGKKVLVIDDEDAILQMVRETLTEQGYEVDVVRDGESALSRLGQTSYDLALCDWKMPGLNGQQVYERLRVSNPKLSERVIFITGDVINDKAEKFLRESRRVCLSKPFSLVEFRAAIGKALTGE